MSAKSSKSSSRGRELVKKVVRLKKRLRVKQKKTNPHLENKQLVEAFQRGYQAGYVKGERLGVEAGHVQALRLAAQAISRDYFLLDIMETKQLYKLLAPQYISHEYYPLVHEVVRRMREVSYP